MRNKISFIRNEIKRQSFHIYDILEDSILVRLYCQQDQNILEMIKLLGKLAELI